MGNKGGRKMVSAILAIILVNLGQRLLMTILGARVMFFSGKKKFMWYVMVWVVLMQILGF